MQDGLFRHVQGERVLKKKEVRMAGLEPARR